MASRSDRLNETITTLGVLGNGGGSIDRCQASSKALFGQEKNTPTSPGFPSG